MYFILFILKIHVLPIGALVFYPQVSFDIQAVYAKLFNFLDSLLDEGILLNANYKAEIISFPGSVAAVLQVLSIVAVFEGICSGSGTKKS